MLNKVSVLLSENGHVILSTVNRFGEHHLVEIDDNEAEELLFDLHSIVMTKRGHNLPSGRIRRFFKRV